MFKKRFLSVIVVMITLSWLAGCNSKPRPEGMPKLYPCTIKITDQDGNPIPQVTVMIVSDDPTFKWGASGATDASGIAKMKTLGEWPGVAAGAYKVTSSQWEYIPTGTFDEEGFEIVELKALLKPEYSNPKKTPWTIEVETKATNVTLQAKKK